MDNATCCAVLKSLAGVLATAFLGGCTVSQGGDRSSKEIEDLRARVHALETRVGQGPRVELPPLNEAQLRQAMAQVEVGLVKQLDDDIAKEGQNQAQSARVTKQLGPLLGQAHVDNLRCSAALCRLETTHPSEAAYGQFFHKGLLGFTASWQGAFTITAAQALPKSAGAKDAPYKSVVFLGPDPGEKFTPPVTDDCGGCGTPQRLKGAGPK